MKIERFDDPWPHLIWENFFPEKMFDEICRFAYAKVPVEEPFLNYYFGKSSIRDYFQKHMNVIETLLDIEPYDLTKITMNFAYHKGPNLGTEEKQSNVHTDALDKMYSLLLPISYYGVGTYLYNKKIEFVKETPWKPNQVIILPRNSEYFHRPGYLKEGSAWRITLNIYPSRSLSGVSKTEMAERKAQGEMMDKWNEENNYGVEE